MTRIQLIVAEYDQKTLDHIVLSCWHSPRWTAGLVKVTIIHYARICSMRPQSNTDGGVGVHADIYFNLRWIKKDMGITETSSSLFFYPVTGLRVKNVLFFRDIHLELPLTYSFKTRCAICWGSRDRTQWIILYKYYTTENRTQNRKNTRTERIL